MPSSNEIRDRARQQARAVAAQTQRRGRRATEDVRSLVDDTSAEARGLAGVLSEAARTQVLALLGATDLARSAVGRRTEELPAQATRRAAALSGTARPANLATVVRTARHDAESRLAQARSTYTGLAQRGERVLTDLRRDPRLLRVLGATDHAVQDAADRVGEQADSVAAAAAGNARSVSATRAAATRQQRTEARRQAATKAAATRRARAAEDGSATDHKTTGHKTAGRQTTARQPSQRRAGAAKTAARSGTGRRSGASTDRRTTR